MNQLAPDVSMTGESDLIIDFFNAYFLINTKEIMILISVRHI